MFYGKVNENLKFQKLTFFAKKNQNFDFEIFIDFSIEHFLISENIFWFRPATAANADNIYKMRVMAYQYVNDVRDMMCKVWYVYTRHGIMDMLFREKYGYGVFVSKRLCDLVEKLSGIKVEEVNSEITWHFPLDQRILYLFRQYPTATLTIEQIIERIIVPHSTRIIFF